MAEVRLGAKNEDDLPSSPKEGGIRRSMKPMGLAMPAPAPEPKDLSDSGRFQDGLFQIHSRGLVVSDSAMSEGGGDSLESSRQASSAVTFDLGPEDFDNLEVIGHGAGGFVRKAFHKRSQTVMALKIINVFEQDKKKQLMTEVDTLFRAHCPQLVTFHGAFSHEGAISIALDYCTAGALSDLVNLSPGGIEESIAALITEQMILGLRFMHKDRHQVHRDFKPSNLLLDHSGRVLLTDFGVSTTLHDSTSLCTTFVGTYQYMSPERFQGDTYSFSADIWSAGVILLEMLTGSLPWKKSRGYWEVMSVIVHDPAPHLPEGGSFSANVQHFLAQCLQKAADQRLSAGELLLHPFITTHCASLTTEEKQQRLAAWIASLRSVFVCFREPEKPFELGYEFVIFYRSLYARRRQMLASLYREESEFTLCSNAPVRGREKIMQTLMKMSMLLTPEENPDWKASCSVGERHAEAKTVIVRSKGVAGMGTPYREDFVLVEDRKSRSFWVLSQTLVIGEE